MWSRYYNFCKNCGTINRYHIARGLCSKCYNQAINEQHKNERGKRGKATKLLTQELLLDLYHNQGLSLGDIGSKYNCSRQFVMKKIKEFGIATRTKEDARKLAIQRGKIHWNLVDSYNGSQINVQLKETKINENFFTTWSDKMAYVLGVIYTDGVIHYVKASHAKKKYLRFGVSQKEPELLEKVLALMDSTHRIRKKRINLKTNPTTINFFEIQRQNMCKDLINLGVTPKKSLTIKFPDIPDQYVRHFIRGCWDGDGSIFENSRANFRASYISASYDFIFGFTMALKKDRIKNIKFDVSKKENRTYTIYLNGNENCSKLFEYLYDGVSENMYLERKYILFKKAYELNEKAKLNKKFRESIS